MKKIRGFTLVELIIVIVLSAIIVTVVSSILAQGFSAYLTGANVTDAEWQGQIALERMVRDIRALRSANDISTASASQFSFTDFSGTSISYTLSGTSLQRNGTALADGIQSLTFNYYDKNGTATATATLIRYIKITLNVTQKNVNFSLITSVYPRNSL